MNMNNVYMNMIRARKKEKHVRALRQEVNDREVCPIVRTFTTTGCAPSISVTAGTTTD